MKTIFQQIKRYDGKTLFVEGQSFKIVLHKKKPTRYGLKSDKIKYSWEDK